MTKVGLETLHYNFWLGLIAQAIASIESLEEVLEVLELGDSIAEDMGTEQFLKVEREINLVDVIESLNEEERKPFLRDIEHLIGCSFNETDQSKDLLKK